MPSQGLKDERVRELAGLAEGYGKLLAGEAYGPQGPGLDVDLATMEDLAVAMQEGLLKGLCETLTQRQAERLAETQPCPGCGRECRVEQPEDAEDACHDPHHGGQGRHGSRTMRLRRGAFDLAEPRCSCRTCRRSFFPSADGPADQQPRL